jgi:hypothetical protein
LVARVDIWVVNVHNVHIIVINKVSLMAVTLVGIEVNDHDPTNPVMHAGTMHYEGNIWVYTKSSSVSFAGMMIASCKVDCPAMHESKARGINRALSGSLHRF